MNPSAVLFSVVDKSTYFDRANVDFVKAKAEEIISSEYENAPPLEIEGVVRVMRRMIESKYEPVMYMNRRAIMAIVNDFREFQHTSRKALRYAEDYKNNTKLYDVDNRMLRFDFKFKTLDTTPNNAPRRFYFTGI